MSAPASALVTADMLLEMPADGTRRELVDGELRIRSPAGDRHGRVAVRAVQRLANHAERHQLGDVAVHESGGVRHFRSGDMLDGGDVLPGLRLPLADLLS